MPPIILGSLPLVSFPNNQCHGHDPCTLALGISIDLIYQVVTYICKIQWHGLRSSTPQGRQPQITLQTLRPSPSHTHTENVTHSLCYNKPHCLFPPPNLFPSNLTSKTQIIFHRHPPPSHSKLSLLYKPHRLKYCIATST